MLPTVEPSAGPFDYPQAEALAYDVGKALQLGDRPGQSLLRILEEVCGVKVFHLEFEPTGTAACTMSPKFGAAVLLNTGSARQHRNFDLAHELFHRIAWKRFRAAGESESAVPAEREEKLATCFASRLLMPTDAMRQALEARRKDGKLTFNALFDSAREFDVSVEALLWRTTFLYRRSEEDTRRDVERVRAMAAPREDCEGDAPPGRPPRFQALAVKALHAGEISLGRFAEYLGIGRRAAEGYLEAKAMNGEEITLAPA